MRKHEKSQYFCLQCIAVIFGRQKKQSSALSPLTLWWKNMIRPMLSAGMTTLMKYSVVQPTVHNQNQLKIFDKLSCGKKWKGLQNRKKMVSKFFFLDLRQKMRFFLFQFEDISLKASPADCDLHCHEQPQLEIVRSLWSLLLVFTGAPIPLGCIIWGPLPAIIIILVSISTLELEVICFVTTSQPRGLGLVMIG